MSSSLAIADSSVYQTPGQGPFVCSIISETDWEDISGYCCFNLCWLVFTISRFAFQTALGHTLVSQTRSWRLTTMMTIKHHRFLPTTKLDVQQSSCLHFSKALPPPSMHSNWTMTTTSAESASWQNQNCDPSAWSAIQILDMNGDSIERAMRNWRRWRSLCRCALVLLWKIQLKRSNGWSGGNTTKGRTLLSNSMNGK